MGRRVLSPADTGLLHVADRLYEDWSFRTSDGKAVFIPVENQEPSESSDEKYPLVLTTGRVRHQWHTMTRTGKVASLLKDCPDPYLQMHPMDAQHEGIRDAEFVEIVSRRGKAVAQVRVTSQIKPGTCFMPFHWTRLHGFLKAANNLTISDRDPMSRQPELKACAVRVRRILDFPLEDN